MAFSDGIGSLGFTFAPHALAASIPDAAGFIGQGRALRRDSLITRAFLIGEVVFPFHPATIGDSHGIARDLFLDRVLIQERQQLRRSVAIAS